MRRSMDVPGPPSSSSEQGMSRSENEHRRLDVIDAVARSIRTSLEAMAISEAALAAIRAGLNPFSVSVHQADPTHRILRLLHISPTPDDRLIQAALRQQLRAYAIHRLQQNLSRTVDERHAAQIHLKLFVRRVGTHLPPALLQHWHAGAR